MVKKMVVPVYGGDFFLGKLLFGYMKVASFYLLLEPGLSVRVATHKTQVGGQPNRGGFKQVTYNLYLSVLRYSVTVP